MNASEPPIPKNDKAEGADTNAPAEQSPRAMPDQDRSEVPSKLAER